jgi:hypothetical protein
METDQAQYEVPTWLAAVITVVVLGTFGFYVLVFGGESGPVFGALFGAISVALTLFVVYLFYRFVVAVETIAKKL